jgi:hypothetical protein
MASMGARAVEIRIEPQSEEYDPNDSRWLETVDALKHDLRRKLPDHDGDLRERERIVPGQKGVEVDLVLALGSSGAIAAAIEVIKAWLADGRNTTRRLVCERRAGTHVKRVVVTVDGIGEKEAFDLMKAALSERESAAQG